MSSTYWYYGVVKRETPDGTVYAIHELYSNARGELAYTQDPVTFEADTLSDLYAEIAAAYTNVQNALTGADSEIVLLVDEQESRTQLNPFGKGWRDITGPTTA